jgi:hypothetical protein
MRAFLQTDSVPPIPDDNRIGPDLLNEFEESVGEIMKTRPLEHVFSNLYANIDEVAGDFIEYHEQWLEKVQVEQYQNYLKVKVGNDQVDELRPEYEEKFIDKLSMRKILSDQGLLKQNSNDLAAQHIEKTGHHFEKYHFTDTDYPYIPLAHPPIEYLASHHAHRVGSQWLRAMDPHLVSNYSDTEAEAKNEFINRIESLGEADGIIAGNFDIFRQIRTGDRYECETAPDTAVLGHLNSVPVYRVRGDFAGMILNLSSEFWVTELNPQSEVIRMEFFDNTEYDSLYDPSKKYIEFVYSYLLHVEGEIGEIYHSR